MWIRAALYFTVCSFLSKLRKPPEPWANMHTHRERFTQVKPMVINLSERLIIRSSWAFYTTCLLSRCVRVRGDWLIRIIPNDIDPNFSRVPMHYAIKWQDKVHLLSSLIYDRCRAKKECIFNTDRSFIWKWIAWKRIRYIFTNNHHLDLISE